MMADLIADAERLPRVPFVDRATGGILEAAFAVHGRGIENENDPRTEVLAGRIADLRGQMPPMATGGASSAWIALRDDASAWLEWQLAHRKSATDRNLRLFSAAMNW